MLLHRARDIHKCLKSIGSFTDGQAEVVSWDSDHLEWITIRIFPQSGPYKGGKYNFTIRFDKQYPKQPPQVDCVTPIYHPNIDMTADDYNVCLSLFDEWVPSFGLEDVIQGLLFLLYYPNLEDPLSPWFDPSMDIEEFTQNLRKTLHGEEIEDAIDFVFPKMIDAQIEKKLETAECIELEDTSQNTDKEDLCLSTSDIISRENDAKSNSAGVTNFDKANSIEDNSVINDQVNIAESCNTLTENAIDCEENTGPDKISPGDTDINSNENEALKPTEAPCSHTEIVSCIEDKFLTGFSELMAMDLFTDDDDDSDELTDFSEEEFEEVSDYEGGEVSSRENERMSDHESFLPYWKDKIFSLLQYVMGSRFRIRTVAQSSEEMRSDTDTNFRGSEIQTCVDTGHTYWEEIKLDSEELELFLISMNQRQSSQNDMGRESSDTDTSLSLDNCDTRTSRVRDRGNSERRTELTREAVCLACYCILSKYFMYYRISRMAPILLLAFYVLKYVDL